MSISEADEVLAKDARFETEAITIGSRTVNAWKSGPKHISDILAMTDVWSDEIFLVADSKHATFGDFRRAVSNCSHALSTAGVEPGDRVALLMRNRIEWPVAFFAIMLLGAIVVPVNGWETDEKVALMLSDAGARHLISDAPRQVENGRMELCWCECGDGRPLGDIIPPAEAWSALAVAPPHFPSLDPEAIGAIFFTSGTSGRPKGATLTHRAMTAALRNSEYQRARYSLRYPPAVAASPPSRPTALFPVPLFHVTAAVAGLVVATASGTKMVLINRWNPEEGLRIIERERVTLLGGVPTLALQLLQHTSLDKHDLSSLTDCLYGGAPAPSSLPGDIKATLGARSANGWGMTETASTFLLNTGQDYLDRPKSCGVVVPAVNEARIADAHDKPVAVGEQGELQVRGLTVTQGYWNAPAVTAEVFTHDDWFRTGDFAIMDHEGFVTITDRIKDVIIRGGENIFTVEIEDALASYPDIVEAAVFARAHLTLGEEVVAMIVTGKSGIPVLEELQDFLRSRLARHKVPVEIFVIDSPLPRNAAGKVLKSELKRLLSPRSDRAPDDHAVSAIALHRGNTGV
ncbi:MAG: class I adenylate-forming enzyme family protein [Candidatus Acidiferrales bacterium]